MLAESHGRMLSFCFATRLYVLCICIAVVVLVCLLGSAGVFVFHVIKNIAVYYGTILQAILSDKHT